MCVKLASFEILMWSNVWLLYDGFKVFQTGIGIEGSLMFLLIETST